MKDVDLYAFGRSTVAGSWEIDRNRIVNRLYHVNAGAATVRSGSREYRLTAGNTYVIPRCQNFKPMCAENFDHTYFDFYTARILNFESIIEIGAGVPCADDFFSYVNRLIATHPREALQNAMEQFLSGFLTLINDVFAPLPYISNASLTEAVRIIHNEYPCITTARLAKKLNLNESYFVRSFTAAMGLSPMKYIRAIRVSYGKSFMQNGMSVTEAAEKCGYSSSSAFYNAMKAELGIAPSDIRKNSI